MFEFGPLPERQSHQVSNGMRLNAPLLQFPPIDIQLAHLMQAFPPIDLRPYLLIESLPEGFDGMVLHPKLNALGRALGVPDPATIGYPLLLKRVLARLSEKRVIRYGFD